MKVREPCTAMEKRSMWVHLREESHRAKEKRMEIPAGQTVGVPRRTVSSSRARRFSTMKMERSNIAERFQTVSMKEKAAYTQTES